MKCCHTGKSKFREPKELRALTNRLSRIEGQVRGVKGMVDSNAYCVDILVQVSAIRSALDAFSRKLLEDHIKTCVADGIKEGDHEVIEELIQTIKKMR